MLNVENIYLRFGKKIILENVNFDASKGEIICLLGPSGCGKTSTLRLIAGLDAPGGGRILIGDKVVSTPTKTTPPHNRGVGFLFQDRPDWRLLPEKSFQKLYCCFECCNVKTAIDLALCFCSAVMVSWKHFLKQKMELNFLNAAQYSSRQKKSIWMKWLAVWLTCALIQWEIIGMQGMVLTTAALLSLSSVCVGCAEKATGRRAIVSSTILCSEIPN